MPAERYLQSVHDLGLSATEFGPEGYLPEDGDARRRLLESYGLQGLGAFVPVMLFRADHDPLPEIERILDIYVKAGASTIILAAVSGGRGYDDRPELDEEGWARLFDNLARICAAARARGIVPTLHHHMGTMIQTADEIDRLLDRSDIGLCLDTGHATIAGIRPLDLARRHADRVNFVHLKDVDNTVAARVRGGGLSYMDSLGRGIFRPLGRGDARIAELVAALESAGYEGWYVMEQDAVLADETGLPAAVRDVETCLDFLRGLA